MQFEKGVTYLLDSEGNPTTPQDTPPQPKARPRTTLKHLPILPVQDVLFPYMTLPLKLHDKKSIALVEKLAQQQQPLGIVATRKNTSNPSKPPLYPIGTLAKILKVIHLSGQEVVAILHGKARFTIQKITPAKTHLTAHVKPLPSRSLNKNTKRAQVLIQSIKKNALKLLSTMPEVPNEVRMMLEDIQNPDFLVSYIASSLLSFPKTQDILAPTSGLQRATLLLKYLLENLEFLKIQKQIHRKVHTDINHQQRNIYLRQQIKVLQEELGEHTPDHDEDIQELRAKAHNSPWPDTVKQHFHKTLAKTERLHPGSAEYTNLINYAQTFSEIPWGIYSPANTPLPQAQKTLNKAHHGLHKVKDRILTHLAVQKLKQDQQGRILCLHGPPGVGKTSLCKSIAKALGRQYARISLGGLHDEAELRGHRKTYVGAMIGQIMNAIKNAGTSNPLIVLDEIDKIDNARGNPAAALLEILDPHQNHHFVDNFLGIPFDLSKVFFIATANDTHALPTPLLDRLEIINLQGYPTEEKIIIAQKHLIPTARHNNGLTPQDITVPTPTLQHLIEHYTDESGVRELARQLDILCSKTAKDIVLQQPPPKRIHLKHLPQRLGPPPFDKQTHQTIHKPGTSIGLAWTPTGGEILFIEAILYKGEGKLITSGQLGDVMEESALTALSYLKAHAHTFHISPKTFKQYDLHIHVPDGATPKDGPSAGVALLTAITSLYTQRLVKDKLAMTGEVTLRGNILPVGGIQEKILAARRAHLQHIILSPKNKKDVQEINPEYLHDLHFHYTDNVADLLQQALEPNPIPHPAPWVP